MLDHVGPGVFGLTPFTTTLADPVKASPIDLFFDVNGPACNNLPTYVAGINYENPSDPVKGNLAQALGQSLWEFIASHPESEVMLGRVMSTYAANRPHFTEAYPLDRLLEPSQPDGVLLVDCGGSIGHDIGTFAKLHPERRGRLVLQDRPAVLENAKDLNPAIEKMEYDFFTPQPIQGAAAYYL